MSIDPVRPRQIPRRELERFVLDLVNLQIPGDVEAPDPFKGRHTTLAEFSEYRGIPIQQEGFFDDPKVIKALQNLVVGEIEDKKTGERKPWSFLRTDETTPHAPKPPRGIAITSVQGGNTVDVYGGPEGIASFIGRLREKTEEYWPELWLPISDHVLGKQKLVIVKKGGETFLVPEQQADVTGPEERHISPEELAWEVVSRMRVYLRMFWEESSGHASERQRARKQSVRDWYIHRAREFHYRLCILHELQPLKVRPGLAREIIFDRMLDKPPQRNFVEAALCHLQELATEPSRAPQICLNSHCEEPYFLRAKELRDYCSLECRQSKTRRIKTLWERNKRKKRKLEEERLEKERMTR
jgi:hypothetical protein